MSIVTQINSTKFRSLKYGGDRLNGGSSNQPYIKTPIPDKSPGTGGPDFLLRGGLLLPGRVLNDVSRITQMFLDIKSPNGLLFAAKQNILSLTEVNTKAGGNVLNNLLDINSKIYLPTSTIAQVALTAEGGHLSKQGIIPQNLAQSLFGSILGVDNSRLSNLYNNHIAQSSTLAPVMSTNILYSYGGGPGSVLGIGTTNILLSKDRTGLNNPNSYAQNNFRINLLKDFALLEKIQNDKKYRTGASNIYREYINNSTLPISIISQLSKDFNESTKQAISSYNVKPGNIFDLNSDSSLSYEHISNQKTSSNPQDFRTQISGSNNPLYSKSLNYKTQGIDKRINFDPIKHQTSDYSLSGSNSYDKINALEIYRSQTLTKDLNQVNDLVKFRIAVIDNDTPNFSTYIHFRAYIDSFSDSYNSEWNSSNYVGRGEKFYRYNGFTREISLGWTVVAQSKAELAPMYKKLNYLASSLAPDYSTNGYMRGNMVKLTIGGYLYEQPGIITSLTYDIPNESPWEIGVGTDQTRDDSVKELPHIIRVTGVRFIPIHNFVPQIFDITTKQQKFISLANGISSEKTLY